MTQCINSNLHPLSRAPAILPSEAVSSYISNKHLALTSFLSTISFLSLHERMGTVYMEMRKERSGPLQGIMKLVISCPPGFPEPRAPSHFLQGLLLFSTWLSLLLMCSCWPGDLRRPVAPIPNSTSPRLLDPEPATDPPHRCCPLSFNPLSVSPQRTSVLLPTPEAGSSLCPAALLCPQHQHRSPSPQPHS